MNENTNTASKRIEYFDTAKAYLIFLVIIGHILIVLNPRYDKLLFSSAQAFIYSFHMPAFFIIHGVIFNNEKWRDASVIDFVKKRAYSLLVPYVFFEVIGIVWKFFFVNQDLPTGLYNLITVRCNVGADWFLIAMFMGSLLFMIYVKLHNKIYAAVTIILAFILPMFMSGHQITVVLGRGLLAYGFIMIGNILKDFFKSEKTKSIIWLICSFVITVAVAIVGLKWLGNDFFACIIKNPMGLVVGGISGTVFILGLSRILKCRMITAIGNHTLTIMGTHQLIIYAGKVLIPFVNSESVAYGIILFVIIVFFEAVVVWIIDRHLPFLVGKKKNRSN